MKLRYLIKLFANMPPCSNDGFTLITNSSASNEAIKI